MPRTATTGSRGQQPADVTANAGFPAAAAYSNPHEDGAQYEAPTGVANANYEN